MIDLLQNISITRDVYNFIAHLVQNVIGEQVSWGRADFRGCILFHQRHKKV